ncbi:ATP-binding protein [Streptomyces sp. CB01373]|uniref:ATP-binding protein n=1 Tax=Streptomyces sp. CB01373 TaxID=2020325 RepID=UPI003FA37EBA
MIVTERTVRDGFRIGARMPAAVALRIVANVVRHVPDRRCTLLVLRQTGGVRVEVTDGSPQLPAVPLDLSPEAEGGRGLLLVDAVTDKWGVEPRGGAGKTVWFECVGAGTLPP